MNVQNSEGESSDVSSKSSWTIIDDENNLTEDDDFVDVAKNATTFDELLDEHSSQFKSQSKHQFRPKKRKCRPETVGVLSLCASLFTVTGIALLCLVFPENVEPKHFDVIKSNYQSMIKNDTVDYKDVVANFGKTLDVLKVANETKLIERCATSFAKNNTTMYGPFPRSKTPKSTTSLVKTNRRVFYPPGDVCYKKDYYKFLDDEFCARNSPVKLIQKKKSAVSLKGGELLRTVLENSTLRCVICAILNDICLLKLMSYLNRTPKKKTKNTEAKKSTKRFTKDELAEAIDSLCPVEKPKTKKATKRPAKIKTKPSDADVSKELLRNKSEDICERHKSFVSAMKDRFRSEIDDINESKEEESFVRLHKIEQTRERFRATLRKNRERYLKALRKMKTQRAKMMRELCAKKELDRQIKDACVGNYVVPMSDANDFYAKLHALDHRRDYVKVTPWSREKFDAYASMQQQEESGPKATAEVPEITSMKSFPLMKISNTDQKNNKGSCDSPWSQSRPDDSICALKKTKDWSTNAMEKQLKEDEVVRRSDRDIYAVAFESKALDAKREESRLLSLEKMGKHWMNVCKIPSRALEKRDPQKCYKSSILHYKKLL